MQHTFFSKNIKGIFFQLQHFQLFVWVHKKIITTVSTTKNYLPTRAKIFCVWLCDKSFKKSIVRCVEEIADALCQKRKLSVIQKVSTIFYVDLVFSLYFSTCFMKKWHCFKIKVLRYKERLQKWCSFKYCKIFCLDQGGLRKKFLAPAYFSCGPWKQPDY